MPVPAYVDALVHYRTQFPTLDSLGVGDPPTKWKSELDEVSGDALGQVTSTSASFEGGSSGGVVNFSQVHKVRALHARRAELDDAYTNPYTVEAAEPLPGRRIGQLVRLGW